MNKPIQDRDAMEQELARLDHVTAEPQETDVPARPCPVPVRPGNHNAQAAYKAGCEDEWIDRMQARYGGEW